MERFQVFLVTCFLALASAGTHWAFAAAPQSASVCKSCGVIESVHAVKVKGKASGAGAIGGAVLGGIVGHQFGSGRGNTLATIAGAGGGAYAGHQIERNMKSHVVYKVKVRMDEGHYRTFGYTHPPGFAPGNRVHVINGKLRTY
jgi:outer membrane lipoprotein SlyB